MPIHLEPQQFAQIHDSLLAALDSQDIAGIHALLKEELSTVDIAHILESTPHKFRKDIWNYLSENQKGEVISHLGDDLQLDFLERMSPQQIVNSTQELDSDDITDLLQQLPEKHRNLILHTMEPENRLEVEGLLAWPEDTAGGLMNPDLIRVRANVSLDVILRFLRRQKDLPDHFESIFVVNRNDQFVGLLPLHRLVVSDPELTVREVMNSEIEGIPADMDDGDVARLFANHDLLSAPVVDNEGRLLGQITIDDVVDVIQGDADHTVMSMAGLDEEQDTFAPIIKSAKSRAIWLGINLLTAFVAALVILKFEDAIAIITALAVLNPVVASMGGVAGSQTLTLVIRAQAMNQISSNNFTWLLGRELGVGIINGLLWAIVTAGISYLLFSDANLSFVAGFAILVNVVIAKIAGASLPVLLKRLGIDPALSGSVVLTTITDSVGFFTLLGFASWYLL